MDAEKDRCTTTDLNESFESFFEFRRSLIIPKKTTVIKVSDMMMRNLEIAGQKPKRTI